MTILSVVLILGGLFFITVSNLGLIRLPDFYSRTHAVGKSETLGAMLLLGGLAFYNGLNLTSLKLVLIIAFVMIANPTATHAITRVALRSEIEIWTGKTVKPDDSRSSSGGVETEGGNEEGKKK